MNAWDSNVYIDSFYLQMIYYDLNFYYYRMFCTLLAQYKLEYSTLVAVDLDR